jgi:hypothetical protein
MARPRRQGASSTEDVHRCRGIPAPTLPAPDIVEAIMDVKQPANMTLPVLMKAFPVERERPHHHHCSASRSAGQLDASAHETDG